MSQARTQEDLAKLRTHVQDLLNKQLRRKSFRLKVLEDVRQEDDWVYLLVTPTRRNVRVSDYAEVLSGVEASLRRDEGIEGVLLVPAIDE